MIGETSYLPFIENVKIGDVSLQLMVISDDPGLEKTEGIISCEKNCHPCHHGGTIQNTATICPS